MSVQGIMDNDAAVWTNNVVDIKCLLTCGQMGYHYAEHF